MSILRFTQTATVAARIGSALAVVFSLVLSRASNAQVTTGTITGTVKDASDSPITGVSIGVWLHGPVVTDRCTNPATGQYTFTNVPLDAPLLLNGGSTSCGPHNFVQEWWQESPTLQGATPITLTAGSPDALFIDFTLGVGGIITGVIRDESGMPLPNENACVTQFDTFQFFGCGSSMGGVYQVQNLPGGDYRVLVGGESGSARNWYNNAYLFNLASRVPVITGETTSGIDFVIGSSIISGTVYESDGLTPLPGMEMCAGLFDIPPFAPPGCIGTTGSDGTYTLRRLRAGSYRVSAGGPGWGRNYFVNTPDVFAADPVTVTLGGMTNTINFTLNPSGYTPAGSNVVVAPSDNSLITFSAVQMTGTTTIQTVTENTPPIMTTFALLGNFHELTTTAQFDQAQVCFTYSDVGLAPEAEARVRLYHYENVNGTPVDITDIGYPDVAINRVCGTVANFSPFAVFVTPQHVYLPLVRK